MTALVVILALLATALTGTVVGAWFALQWVRKLRPGREGDLLAELAALRASTGLHKAALVAQAGLWRTPMSGGGQ